MVDAQIVHIDQIVRNLAIWLVEPVSGHLIWISSIKMNKTNYLILPQFYHLRNSETWLTKIWCVFSRQVSFNSLIVIGITAWEGNHILL